jgi:hypothetical protein
MTYYGIEEDPNGMPSPWFHYLVLVIPGVKPDSGVASIISLTEARAKGIAQGLSHTIFAKNGGPEEAVKLAEAFLDREHPGLKKIITGSKG